MPDISPIGHGPIGPLHRVNGVAAYRTQIGNADRLSGRASDRVELSDHARLLDRLRLLPDIRQDLVDRVRSEIDADTYDTPEQLDAAAIAMYEEEFTA